MKLASFTEYVCVFIFQTMANTLGLYVQNLLAIDACATPHEDAARLMTKQVRPGSLI